MINKTLTNQCKSNIPLSGHLSFVHIFFMQFPVPLKDFFLHRLSFHRNHVPLTSRIILFVSLGKVIEVVGPQITFTKIVDFFNYRSLLFNRGDFSAFEILVFLKNPYWNYVIVNSCQGVMSHVKTFYDS